MDYSDYSQQSQQSQQQQQTSPQRTWPPQLLTPSSQTSAGPSQAPFSSPVSPGPYFFPNQPQSAQHTSPTNDARPASGLSLNISALSVTSPTTLSPIGPHPHAQHQHQGQGSFHPHHALHSHQQHQIQSHHPHHTHSHSHSSSSVLSVSPITPVSPPNFSPAHLSPQPTFTFNFEDGGGTSAGGGGLSPTPDSVLTQRRPSTGSHSASSSELAVEKSVPRKRSLTNTLPGSQSSGLGGQGLHAHSQSHSFTQGRGGAGHGPHVLPHPIITTTASSPPPPTSPVSPSSSHPSHSLSHSRSHSSLSQSLSHSTHSSVSQSQHAQSNVPQIDINIHPSSYDDLDSAGAGYTVIGDDASDDEFGGGAFGVGFGTTASSSGRSPTRNSGQGSGQGVIGKPMGTNNFVTKLYQMINDPKSQHFISWTELGTSFVVSNVGEFSRSILGSHFKHNNFSSFVRQLNMYGFHKINRTPRAQRSSTTSQTWEFSHPKFLKARPDLLDAIKRKALEPDPRERSRVELPGEVARLLSELREENRALWKEVGKLGGRVPSHVNTNISGPTSAPAVFGPATGFLGFGSSSASGQGQGAAQTLQGPSGGQGQGHVLTHSRSSSNLGADDDGRELDWDDEENGPAGGGGMGGMTLVPSGGGGSGGEEWDPQSQSQSQPQSQSQQGTRYIFGGVVGGVGGLSVPTLSPAPNAYGGAGGLGGGSAQATEEWRRWAEAEISRERGRVEKLVGVVRTLVEVVASPGASVGNVSSGTVSSSGVNGIHLHPGDDEESGEGGNGTIQSILKDLHDLSLSLNHSHSSSPLSVLMPSPSPSPSPHLHPFSQQGPGYVQHQHSPNIYITSPTSPSPFSSSQSQIDGQGQGQRSSGHAHPSTLPTLSIPNSSGGGQGPGSHQYALHTPSSSPTATDFPAQFFGHTSHNAHQELVNHGHSRSVSSLSSHSHHLSRQPSITLTVDHDGRGEAKRQRTDGLSSTSMSVSSDSGKDKSTGADDGESMDIVPPETSDLGGGIGELDVDVDVKLPTPMSMTSPIPPGQSMPSSVLSGSSKMLSGTAKATGLRARSDSAPMWGGRDVQGNVSASGASEGLNANWGRGRSGSSYGR